MAIEVVVMRDRQAEDFDGSWLTSFVTVDGRPVRVTTPASKGIDYHQQTIEGAIDANDQARKHPK